MDVLVVGSGAREHALVRGLRRDPSVGALHAAPGNPGIAADVDAVHPLDAADPDAVAALAVELGVDLVVVGPELPLVRGVVDAVRAAAIACFGPSAAAARLEGSKAFAKDVMAAAGVPTAMAHLASTAEEVAAALDAFGPPYVVKDDGLAAGKGVIVTTDRSAAVGHARGRPVVVVEEHLDGPEVSLFCLSDGETVVPLLPAQDAKRVGDGDTGPNTGGMGAYAPLPWAPADLAADVVERVARPVVAELGRRGTPFTGLLYVGLALTSRGLRVVEFNVRFGDPETQAVLALLRTPLGALLHATATGTLASVPELAWHPGSAVTVVVAAEGYPGTSRTGDPLEGLADAASGEGVEVHHAGTRAEAGRVVSSGGRVLSVTARAPDLAAARDRAYEAVARIRLRGSHHRSDIAAGALLAVPDPS